MKGEISIKIKKSTNEFGEQFEAVMTSDDLTVVCVAETTSEVMINLSKIFEFYSKSNIPMFLIEKK